MWRVLFRHFADKHRYAQIHLEKFQMRDKKNMRRIRLKKVALWVLQVQALCTLYHDF